jgi:hypothetical protein
MAELTKVDLANGSFFNLTGITEEQRGTLAIALDTLTKTFPRGNPEVSRANELLKALGVVVIPAQKDGELR